MAQELYFELLDQAGEMIASGNVASEEELAGIVSKHLKTDSLLGITMTLNVGPTREALIGMIVNDTLDSARNDCAFRDTFIEETLWYGHAGLEHVPYGKLLRQAKEAGLLDRIACPKCGEAGYSDPKECSFCQDQES